MNANPILLQKKYSRVVDMFAQKSGISLDEALDIFYCSSLYRLVSEGVSDMHCMSDEYLVEELEEEYQCIRHPRKVNNIVAESSTFVVSSKDRKK